MKKRLPVIAEEIPEAMSIKYNTKVYELQRQKKKVAVLSLGEAFFNIPRYSFSNIPFEKGYHYSNSRGLIELREKVSNYYNKKYGVFSDANTEVLISAGSKIIIYMALLAILNPGDEVIIFEPAWVSYTEQVRLCRGVPKTIPYNENLENMKKYITGKTRALIVNTPNNPSGKVYSKEELQFLFKIAARYDLYIISDEAYSDFVLEQEPFVSAGCLDKKKERIIIINSLSKNLGISGWRIGYVITNPELINIILKVNQHIMTCPTTLIEYYLIHYFDDILNVTKPQIKEVVEKRMIISKYMEEIGLSYLPGTGTFYFCVSIEGSKLNSEEFADRLLSEYYIATVPGLGYGKSLDKFLRIGVGTESLEVIKKSLMTIKKLIQGTSE